MKRKPVVSVALAFLFCSILGRAQDQPATTIVHTAGGTVNAVAKFTGKSVIGNSAISETGGNVSVRPHAMRHPDGSAHYSAIAR